MEESSRDPLQGGLSEARGEGLSAALEASPCLGLGSLASASRKLFSFCLLPQRRRRCRPPSFPASPQDLPFASLPGPCVFSGPAAERRESQNAGSSFGESREGRSYPGCPNEATKKGGGSSGRGRATLWQPFASASASRAARDLFSGSQPFLPRGETLQVRLDPGLGTRLTGQRTPSPSWL